MAYDIGPKLGIDGYAEFRKAITSINDDVKGFGSELKLVAAIYEQNGDSMEALAAKNDVLQKTYDAQEKKLAEVSKVLERAKAEYGENETAVKKWEQVLTESKAALVKTQNEIEKNSKAMEELAKAAENSTDAFSGFDEIEKAVDDIDDEIKTLASELRAVASAYDESEKNSKGFKQSQEILAKQFDAQAAKLANLKKGLQEAEKLYGENDAETRKWARAVNEAQAELNDLDRELDKSNKGVKKLADGFKGATSAFSVAAGNLLSGGISKIVDGVSSAMGALANLDETTEEYRTAMGKLNTAFTEQEKTIESSVVAHGKFEAVLMDTGVTVEESWRNAETAAEVYKNLYAVLGDTDTAVETAQLMAQLAQSEEDFTEWTRIAAGVAGTFGDALPINSLIEAANETAKVSKVTGALADALNWVGISEDEFNAKLAACTSETERNKLIMDTLSETYRNSADAFYENNKELIKARENQVAMDEAMGKLGESVLKVKNALMEKFGPAIAEVAGKAADFINNVDTDKLFRKFDEAVDKIGNAFNTGWETVKGVYDDFPAFFDGLGDTAENAFDLVELLWKKDFKHAEDEVYDIVSSLSASITAFALEINDVFKDLDWELDFRTAMEQAVKAVTGYWVIEEFGKLFESIGEGIAEGKKAYDENHLFSREGVRSGAFGGGSDPYAYSDNSAYYSANTTASVGNVYLDGKQVGKVLAGVNDASSIASGSEVALLP